MSDQPDDQPDDVLAAVRARFAPGWPAVVSCGLGWYGLIERLDAELTALCDEYVLYQVKEKFGGLRYYFSLPEHVLERPDAARLQADMLRVASAAEVESRSICEETGRPGVLMRAEGGWVRTLDPDTFGPPEYTPVRDDKSRATDPAAARTDRDPGT